MPSSRPHFAHADALPSIPVLLGLLLLPLLITVGLTACGGIEGTYGMTEGEDVMKDFTLTLDGGEFTLAGPNPMGGDDVEFKGTYTVDGDSISLQMAGEESEVGTVNGDRLEFESVVWTKQ